jgi:hypothetical protein
MAYHTKSIVINSSDIVVLVLIDTEAHRKSQIFGEHGTNCSSPLPCFVPVNGKAGKRMTTLKDRPKVARVIQIHKMRLA